MAGLRKKIFFSKQKRSWKKKNYAREVFDKEADEGEYGDDDGKDHDEGSDDGEKSDDEETYDGEESDEKAEDDKEEK